MADQKLTQLTELTTPESTDIIYIVDDPGGTPLERKIPLSKIWDAGSNTMSAGGYHIDGTIGVDLDCIEWSNAYGFVGLLVKPTDVSSTYPSGVIIVEPHDTSESLRYASVIVRDSGYVNAEKWISIGGNPTSALIDFGTKSGAPQDLVFRSTSSFTELMRLTSGGKLGINDNDPERQFTIRGNETAARGMQIEQYKNDASYAALINLYKSKTDTVGSHAAVADNDYIAQVGVSGSDGSDWVWGGGIRFQVDGTVSTGIVPLSINFLTMDTAGGGPTERVIINSNGFVGIGIDPSFIVDITTDDENGRILNLAFTKDHAEGPVFRGDHSRAGAIVQDGDVVFHAIGRGFDGYNFRSAAQIKFQVDGTPGTDDMPGRIVFLTTPDGAYQAVEVARITNAGFFGIGTDAPEGNLHVKHLVDEVTVLEHVTTNTTYVPSALKVRTTSTGDMTDDFGTSITFQIDDSADVVNPIGIIQARRNGADNTGKMRLGVTSAGSWVYPLEAFDDGSVVFYGEFGASERSSDPSDPPEGSWVIWMSDGAGTGDDGDIYIKITANSTTKTIQLIDNSSY